MSLAGDQLGEARGLLERPRHLDLFPVDDAVLPVWRGCPLVQDVAPQLSLLEDVRARPGGLLLVAHFAFGVPLLLAEDHDVRRARVVERHVETHDLAVHGDLVGIDHLDLLHLTDAGPVAGDRWVFAAGVVRLTPQGVRVDHVLRRELAVAVMELDAPMQLHPPGPPVGALRPAIRQPGFVLTRRVDLDEPLLHGVVLDVVIGRPVDPGAHVVQVRRDQPHHQAVHFGLARRLRTRGRGGNQEKDRQQHDVAERASLPNVFSLHGSIPPCSPGLKVRRWMAGDARTDTLRCQQLIDPPDGKS